MADEKEMKINDDEDEKAHFNEHSVFLVAAVLSQNDHNNHDTGKHNTLTLWNKEQKDLFL